VVGPAGAGVTAPWWAAAAVLLVLAAVTATWPARRSLHRLTNPAPRRRPSMDVALFRARITETAQVRPRRLVGLGSAAAAGAGLVVGGWVAAVVAAVYAALLCRGLVRRIREREAAAARSRSLDELSSLAADLRAGLPPAAVDRRDGADPRIANLTAAVWRLAERTGAPAADLMERIEADARAADRARASAAAQAAGARATAMLLAALPAGGIALGYSIGVSPLRILLHTGVGAACALGAVLLQCAGLLWADRLVTGAAR
jgi:tight adherence protein B